MQHTPGPWKALSRSVSDNSLVIKDGEYSEICEVRKGAERSYGKQDDRDVANALLMAASPDLYEALWSMVSSFHGVDYLENHMRQSVQKARAALAKAEGK